MVLKSSMQFSVNAHTAARGELLCIEMTSSFIHMSPRLRNRNVVLDASESELSHLITEIYKKKEKFTEQIELLSD